MTKNIKGIYFDFFGTLVDNRSIISLVWSRIAKKLGVEISPEDPRIWEGVREQWKAFDKLNKEFPDMTKEELHQSNSIVIRKMGANPEGSQDIVREEFANEFSSGENFQLIPECKETLKQINDTGIKMGLLSHASPKLCKPVLERFGILEFFDIFVLTEEVGYHKFQIEIYEIALEKMKTTNPASIIHVGDDLNLDAKMAQKVGMTPIHFNPLETHTDDNITTIKKFSEILNYLH